MLINDVYESNYDIDTYPGVYDANITFYDEEDDDDQLSTIDEEIEQLIELPLPNTPPASA